MFGFLFTPPGILQHRFAESLPCGHAIESFCEGGLQGLWGSGGDAGREKTLVLQMMRFGGWKQTSCWSVRPKSIAKYFNRREAGQHDQLGKMKASAFTSLSSNLPSVMPILGTW